jgi:hypothetical protein
MPVQTTYPGIYIEELPSSVHTITAAPTSVTVFVGYTHPFKTRQFGKPIELFSFKDYETWFGGFFGSDHFQAEADLFGDVAQAVNQFFLNGGANAWVVGLLPQALNPAWSALTTFNQWVAQEEAGAYSYSFPGPAVTLGPLTFLPIEITDADHQMQVGLSNVQVTPQGDNIGDVTVTYGPPATSPLAGSGTRAETYRQVSTYPYIANGTPNTTKGKPNPNYVLTRIDGISSLVRVAINYSAGPLPTAGGPVTVPPTLTAARWKGFGQGNPVIFQANDFISVFQQDSPLDKLSIFNLLVIPGVTNNQLGSVLASATAFCERKQAFLIMDPPRQDSADGTVAGYPTLIEDVVEGNASPRGENVLASSNSALYFPYLTTNDPLTGLGLNPATNPPSPFEMPPSGTIAGIYASTDLTRGVWKAPAGLATVLTNVNDVVERGRMTDPRQGVLNQIGVNCVRTFPGVGPVVWGARTSISANLAFQQWKYIPVRRMALFIEQTLYANLGWVVFEPNDESLWTAIRTSIESFMLGLFRQGAFPGTTPSQAFQVKCDDQTTTQADIDNGIVNIVVAFAPLKPAEFVVIQISQLAGQAQAS